VTAGASGGDTALLSLVSSSMSSIAMPTALSSSALYAAAAWRSAAARFIAETRPC
jgi:hypothetical protein